MIDTDVLVVGGGPAGMNAALASADAGAKVVLLDKFSKLGGQLVKQTHKFFGWADKGGGSRGIYLAEEMAEKIKANKNIKVLLGYELVGTYSEGNFLASSWEDHFKIRSKKLIVCSGASERMILFENNDLPGVMGAGAVQTLVNEYGVLPGERFLIVGSGNVGVILGYQLLQAGAHVDAVIDVLTKMGGAYWVHAAKLQRFGVPLLLGRTLVSVSGSEHVEEATSVRVDEKMEPIKGTEIHHNVDVVALAVGLMPLSDIFLMMGVKTIFIPELGGFVPWHDELGHTSNSNVYVAGDAGGIEEATTASLSGALAGLSAARDLGFYVEQSLVSAYQMQLDNFRKSSLSKKVIQGLEKMRSEQYA